MGWDGLGAAGLVGALYDACPADNDAMLGLELGIDAILVDV